METLLEVWGSPRRRKGLGGAWETGSCLQSSGFGICPILALTTLTHLLFSFPSPHQAGGGGVGRRCHSRLPGCHPGHWIGGQFGKAWGSEGGSSRQPDLSGEVANGPGSPSGSHTGGLSEGS